MKIVNLEEPTFWDPHVVVWAYPLDSGEPTKVVGGRSRVRDYIRAQQQPYYYHEYLGNGISKWGFTRVPLRVERIRKGSKKWAIIYNDSIVVAVFNRMPKEWPTSVKVLAYVAFKMTTSSQKMILE